MCCHVQLVVTAAFGRRGAKTTKLKDIVDSALEQASDQGHKVRRGSVFAASQLAASYVTHVPGVCVTDALLIAAGP